MNLQQMEMHPVNQESLTITATTSRHSTSDRQGVTASACDDFDSLLEQAFHTPWNRKSLS